MARRGRGVQTRTPVTHHITEQSMPLLLFPDLPGRGVNHLSRAVQPKHAVQFPGYSSVQLLLQG
eukprot:1157325-Pelagomonas_calceolata.AAC.3